MSSDDFGTVNVSRAQRAREIEVMRAHYRRHREALVSMAADAPTEGLANAYHSLIRDIDGSLTKLDDLERGVSTPVVPPPPSIPPRHEQTFVDDEPTQTGYDTGERRPGMPLGRVIAIVAIALIALGILGWLVWRDSGDEPQEAIIDTAATDTAPVTEPTPEPEAPSALSVTPASHDYGTIRKGTRATRQYEIRNNSDNPITVTVSRSACRCLYYEYEALIPPKAKESLTVTIDGAKAKSGALNERVQVAAKNDPAVSASLAVVAAIE